MAEIYYHYTNIAGAVGILQSRSVWLTDCRFLNDRNELTKSLDDLSQRFDGRRRWAFDWAVWWYQLSAHQCVLSLSRSPEILSQWRAYADDGRGMALGFHADYFEHADMKIIECVYQNHEEYIGLMTEKHRDALDSIHDEYERCAKRHRYTKEKHPFRDWVFRSRDMFTPIIRDLIALKNPAFSEEQEVRLFKSVVRGAVDIRVSGNLIIPYTTIAVEDTLDSIDPKDMPIREIWLGPKCNPLNWKALHSMDIGPCVIRKYDCGYV